MAGDKTRHTGNNDKVLVDASHVITGHPKIGIQQNLKSHVELCCYKEIASKNFEKFEGILTTFSDQDCTQSKEAMGNLVKLALGSPHHNTILSLILIAV